MTTQTRRKRLERKKDRPNVRITEDDIQLLWHVYRHRVLDANSIRSLFPHRSTRHFTNRLEDLFDAEYLDRPGQQNRNRRREGGGSHSLVYAIAKNGARLLRETSSLPVGIDRWRQKNRELRGHNIEHTLETARFMVALEHAVRAQSDFELLYFDELLRRFSNKELIKTHMNPTLRTRVDWHGYKDREGTAPDQVFAVRNPALPKDRQHRIIFLEIDRGTETISPSQRKIRSRSFFRDTSLLRKFVIYSQAFANKTHTKMFGLPVFQVLTVTTNPDRMLEMQQAYQEHLAVRPHSVRSALFLFSDFETIAGYDGDLLSLPLSDGRGKVFTLA